MKKTIPFDVRFNPYHVYTSKNTILVVKYNKFYSKYEIDDGEIIHKEQHLESNPMKEDENYYWEDYVSLKTIQKIYLLVTKFNYETIIHSLNFLKGYFNCDDVSVKDVSMDHSSASLDQLYFF